MACMHGKREPGHTPDSHGMHGKREPGHTHMGHLCCIVKTAYVLTSGVQFQQLQLLIC